MAELIIDQNIGAHAFDVLTQANAGRRLSEAYPGVAWGVSCKRGILDIRCALISDRYGMTINLSRIFSASELDKKILRAGGELLERAYLKPGRLNEVAMMNAPRNLRGCLIRLDKS